MIDIPTASPDRRFGFDRRAVLAWAFPLSSGMSLAGIEVAYETYGALNADASNAILVCHALTMDQYVAGHNPRTGKAGWWPRLVGVGKAIDPDRHFIICANVLGGCSGSTGPASIDPATGKRFGMAFPLITIRDMVNAQARLLDHLGVGVLAAVVGGSMGGMQALDWAVAYPDRVRSVVAIATAARHSAQNIAFHEVGRQAIMADPNWQGGAYAENTPPAAGLAVARMAAHITYLSEEGLTAKFGRRLQVQESSSHASAADAASATNRGGFGFDAEFQVESYLRYQGLAFVERFDANSYLYITRALDYFDLAAPHDGVLAKAFAATKTRFAVISFTSDWLYPTAESRRIVRALNAAGAAVSFVELESPFGHDAFLLDAPEMIRVVDGFLRAGE